MGRRPHPDAGGVFCVWAGKSVGTEVPCSEKGLSANLAAIWLMLADGARSSVFRCGWTKKKPPLAERQLPGADK